MWVNVLLAMAPQPLSTEFVRDRPAELGTQSTDLEPYSMCWLFVWGLAVLTMNGVSSHFVLPAAAPFASHVAHIASQIVPGAVCATPATTANGHRDQAISPDHLLVMVHKISAIHVSSTDWTGQHITPSFHWAPVSCDRALGRHYRMLLLPIMPSISEAAG